jgi:hypothetical protein
MSQKIDSLQEAPSARRGHAGLVLIGELFRLCRINDITREIEKPLNLIKDWEILRTLCALIAQGKTDFEHVRHFREDSFFTATIGTHRVPSPECLRLRFEQLSRFKQMAASLINWSLRWWKKVKMKPQLTHIAGVPGTWVRLDVDVTLFDNSDTQKEGVGRTYAGVEGYAPVFAHLGGGWLVNAELRPGEVHSHHDGTPEFIHNTLGLARKMVPGPSRLLCVLDCGFESKEVLRRLASQEREPRLDFIVKHNLRRESLEKWLEIAQERGTVVRSETGKTVYQGSIYRRVAGVDQPLRLVFEVTEQTIEHKQRLMVPKLKVFSVWTTLAVSEDQVLRLYRQRGASEQYHSEFKTELDLERLPSGKFSVNRLFLLVGMLVYNMLRVLGSSIIAAPGLRLKKATRRRMKTVMQNLIYLCGRLTRHARQLILQVACSRPWFEVYHGLLHRFRQPEGVL